MNTPDTVTYMIAGYITFTVVMALYISSLVWRMKQAKKEYEFMKQVKSD